MWETPIDSSEEVSLEGWAAMKENLLKCDASISQASCRHGGMKVKIGQQKNYVPIGSLTLKISKYHDRRVIVVVMTIWQEFKFHHGIINK